MWGWSSRVAEHAVATSWTSWQTVETEPTVLDPQEWAEVEAESDDGMSVAVPIREYDLVG
ncbi:hypothetical protein [Nocardia pseudovaccinii]|uniref:hypothetical protein n=1 Tax=Nocardia pseudovaccinii TaxID=189540 RepID=UPI000AC0C065|nr:hypothetical protein [Nocardia pseudovaccinii]